MNEIERLISKFKTALGHYDKMRGFRRSLTVWSQNREKETGSPAFRFLAAFKMRVTKEGLDASLV
jgi:hypothetical protein